MKDVIAIAFSDLHLNMWSKFNKDNRRTLNGFDVLYRISKLCDKYYCPALFCGDLFHKAESLDSGLYDICLEYFDKFDLENHRNSFTVYAISGNHDIAEVNTIVSPKTSWVSRFAHKYDWLKCIDFDGVRIGKYKVHGIPYLDHNVGLNNYLKKVDADILLLHTDYPGAQDTDGRAVDSVENLNINLLKPFKLVLCGHIHKPQRLGKKIYMVGAPQHQRRTDRSCDMGYMKIFNDLTCEFCYWGDYPRFIDVDSEDKVVDDGNYYTVIPKTSRELKETTHKITKQLTKKKLARQYMKQKGNKNKTQLKLLTRVLTKSEKLELC